MLTWQEGLSAAVERLQEEIHRTKQNLSQGQSPWSIYRQALLARPEPAQHLITSLMTCAPSPQC